MTEEKPRLTAGWLALPVLICSLPACRHPAPRAAPGQERTVTASVSLPAGALVPSPRLIVGRVLAVEAAHGFVFVDLASDAPIGAVAEGTELIARTLDLHETGRLRASRYVRGRTLGTKIVSGQPSPGDEVVWLAP